MSDTVASQASPVGLVLDVAFDSNSYKSQGYRSAYVQFADGTFEFFAGIVTLILDCYGDQHQILEPSFTLFVIDGRTAVRRNGDWFERPERGGEYRFSEAGSPRAVELAQKTATLTPIGSTVVAEHALEMAYYSLPRWLMIEGGESDETERIFAADGNGKREEIGWLKAIAPADPQIIWPWAELYVLNEGAAVIISDDRDYNRLAPTLFLLRLKSKAFERITDPSLGANLLAAAKRRESATYYTPIGRTKADRQSTMPTNPGQQAMENGDA
jgi:hypothetical protein